MENRNGTVYFLVSDESIKNLGDGKDCEFFNWLKSEGFNSAEISKGFWSGVSWIYININKKQYVAGMPGIKVVEPIGNHAITINEFKTVFEIYKKYNGKSPLVF